VPRQGFDLYLNTENGLRDHLPAEPRLRSVVRAWNFGKDKAPVVRELAIFADRTSRCREGLNNPRRFMQLFCDFCRSYLVDGERAREPRTLVGKIARSENGRLSGWGRARMTRSRRMEESGGTKWARK
jgi:hypothetical protein